ncbi:TPA: glycosyltransferase [Vibrio cholerae]|uniref:glycosyltransferase n=1 Tax=Vibrio TaxID=662 RepID=UPI0004E41CE8|nr:glycosyltransferase [Vibrio paracholerae]EKO3714464.1 glycosyltransferase [Vibrio metschnikovii]KFD79642.1 glycosyl transferases group 1 family protein [Vibrio paracholerae]QAV03628.1 glycosyl transferases group 1 family protein [Vibrio cholerae]GHX01117.1 Glycosyltransferase [Vibrio cholerae]
MKIYKYSFSFKKGGAAIAARKFYEILVQEKFTVYKVSQDHAGKFQFFLRLISYTLGLLSKKQEPIKHSLNIFSYRKVLGSFEDHNALHHIHWINNDTLSVFSFDRIPKHSIITLHDEWLYCGTEHCCQFLPKNRLDGNDLSLLPFVSGYPKKLINSNGFNWKYIIWKIKYRKISVHTSLIFTVPSTWMLKRAKASLILKNQDVRLLPNPIDTIVFSPTVENDEIRSQYCIDSSDIVITFGAVAGGENPAKGSVLLLEALKLLPTLIKPELKARIKLVTFGKKAKRAINTPFPCVEIGHIAEQTILSKVYGMSDCVVVPSYVESFGQVAAEAQSCGVPVVAFATSGITDVVKDKYTGFLAEPFSSISLAEKIVDLITLDAQQKNSLSLQAREHVINNFSYDVIARKYINIVNEAIKNKKTSERG